MTLAETADFARAAAVEHVADESRICSNRHRRVIGKAGGVGDFLTSSNPDSYDNLI